MIKIIKDKKPPQVLITNESTWTTELLNEIIVHGGYKNLPETIKQLIATRYKHQDIKNALIPKLDTKCAFCESMPNESGYIEVEHYLPKSIYHTETYSWENLLPSCKRCNLKKLALDTGKYPIVKPDSEDPEEYFSYNNIKIIPKKDCKDKMKANRTIKKLELNQHRLIKPRSELLVNLVDYENELEKVLKELKKAINSNKKNRIKNNIMESIDKIDELQSNEVKFSGFCKHYILNSKVINTARKAISD